MGLEKEEYVVLIHIRCNVCENCLRTERCGSCANCLKQVRPYLLLHLTWPTNSLWLYRSELLRNKDSTRITFCQGSKAKSIYNIIFSYQTSICSRQRCKERIKACNERQKLKKQAQWQVVFHFFFFNRKLQKMLSWTMTTGQLKIEI